MFRAIPNHNRRRRWESGRRLRHVIGIVLLLLLAGASLHLSDLLARPRAQQPETATVGGLVLDDRGAPVADAKVTISYSTFSNTVSSRADGKFEFRGIKFGPYLVVAEAPRFLKQTVAINVVRTEETIAPFKLMRSSLHVTVINVSGEPLPRVSVNLYQRERGASGGRSERNTTDERGDAYFGRLAPGAYSLTAVLRGFEEHHSEVYISPDITTELVLQLLVAPVIPINEKAITRYGALNLPSRNVRCVFQDSDGWIWLGTDKGVARFNGAESKSSATAGSPYAQLAGEDVRSVAEDRAGAIWLATARGIAQLGKGGPETRFTLGGEDARHILADSKGNLWVATGRGLFRIDDKGPALFDRAKGLPANDVRATAEDQQGAIWIATSSGVAVFDGGNVHSFAEWQASRRIGGATPAKPSDGASARGRDAAQAEAALASSDVRCLFTDRSGALWFGTNRGVFSYDRGRLEGVAAKMFEGGAEAHGPAAGAAAVGAINQDTSGRIWFALTSGGAILYDPARRIAQRLGFFDRDHIAGMCPGREGDAWIATDNGAVRADLYSFVNFTTSRGLPDNNVRAVAERPGPTGALRSGELWFITSTGVSRLQDERFVPIDHFRANVSVHAAAFDQSGGAWFATEQGAIRLTGQTLKQINEGNGLPSDNVRWVAAINDGAAIIFATARGAAIFRNGELRPVDALEGYDIRHVYADVGGRLWFSTTRGVVRLDPETGAADLINTARGLADDDARWITRFNNKLVIATRAGIQVYSESDTAAALFTTFDGESANTMFNDRDGYLWVGMDDGQVKKFAPGNFNISAVYSSETYALAGSRINSFCEDADGRIWIATDKGVVRHIPVRIAPQTQVALEVDGGLDLLNASPNAAATRELSHGRHKLTFHFAAASMMGQVRYLYRINGGDIGEPWELLPMQPGVERDISRLDLDEGAYTFEVMALNRDLYGFKSPPTALGIRVGAPFWKHWWFLALMSGALGLALAGVIAGQKMRHREYVLPWELRTYVPIEPNPYIVGNPIRNEKMFYGREDDFRYVRTKLEGVSQGVVVVFCGERRVGKSSILYQVLNGRLGERFIPVFVDMQEMVVASDSEFFARISRLIVDAIAVPKSNRVSASTAASGAAAGSRGTPALVDVSGGAHLAAPLSPALAAPEFDGRNPYPIFLDFLDAVLAAIGDRTLLILMDEYELMEGKVDEGKLSTELFTFLAGLMDNKERLALIFTGSRRLEERDKKYWRELLRRSLFRKIGFLTEKDTVRLITEPVAGRMVFGRGVVDAICRLTAGQAFYTQVICQNMVDHLNEHRQNWVTVADLNRVIADIVDNPLPQMIYTWDVLSDDEKLVFSLLGETLADGNGYASAWSLRTSVKANDYPVNLSENTIRVTLEEMFRRDLLEKDAADGFRIKIDLFRLWVRRSHSIWQVVKEVRTL